MTVVPVCLTKPAMPSDFPDPNQGQRALAAIVVTDAVGFSARMSVDEERTLRQINQDLKRMAGQCKDFNGRVLKSTGDGLLMYFVSAVQAVSCAIAIQKALSLQTEDSLVHRVGIHLGDVFFNNSDVMGNGVNIAARLQTQAKPGGICLSQVVYDVVKARLPLNAERVGPLQLKNIQEPVTVYHLTVNDPAADTETISDAKTLLESDAVSPETESTDPEPPAKMLPANAKIAGRYTIKQMLGQGGFGISYLAEDTQRFGELCVLKELRPVKSQGKSLKKAIDLFKREAKTLYRIDHPQIPKFMACFTQSQRLFIVQEYIDGVTYLKLLQHRKKQAQLFTEDEIIPWLAHMLQVLDYLHSLNIMHRDISPENIMYSHERDLPVLIDFGLVNNTMSDPLSDEGDGEDNANGSIQKSATVVGKFGYSPPEQLRFGKCNPSSDLYALGVTALVLLTGKHPRDLMDQHTLDWEWQRYVQVGPQLATILSTMTRQQPKARYPSARAVMQQLEPLLPVEVTKSLSQVPPPLPPRPLAAMTMAPPEQQLSTVDPSFLSQCREELSRCIGPIADLVVEETLEDYPTATPQELVTILAGQISDADQATAFLSHIRLPGGSQTSSQSQLETSTVLQSQPLNPAFVDRCREALTQCVGPMADMILEDTMADYPNLSAPALIDRLAAEIPDGQKAQEFRQQLSGV
ncbi:MAG: protein kinase [Cyanobacteria bacterium J06632_22]